MKKFDFFNFNFEEIMKEVVTAEEIGSIKSYSNEELKEDISNFTSDKLCQIVVAYRYLNYNEELAICAMTELGKRRSAGDNFDFESLIETSLAELPPLNFNLPDIRTLIAGLKK